MFFSFCLKLTTWKPWFHRVDITTLFSELRPGLVVMLCVFSGICNHDLVVEQYASYQSIGWENSVVILKYFKQIEKHKHSWFIIFKLACLMDEDDWLPGIMKQAPQNALANFSSFAPYRNEIGADKILAYGVRQQTWWLRIRMAKQDYWVQNSAPLYSKYVTLLIYLTSLSFNFSYHEENNST